MGHDFTLIYALVGGLTAALLLGYIAQKLRWSPLVGYLVAGMIVGPHTPGIELDKGIVDQFAEIGVILLMFGVGLHFHLKDLLAVQRVALPGSLAQIAVSTALGALIAHCFGWSWMAGVVFGMAVSVASTVVLTRVLADHRDLHTPSGHVALGWLVVEDLFTIFLMVLLPVLLEPGQKESLSAWALAETVGWTIVKLALLVVFTLFVGRRLIPLFLVWVARTGTRDLFTLAVLVLALGIAVCSAELFGASMVLGAFLSGMVVGQSEFSARAAAEALPMRDAFAVLFFVSVGMLFDPAALMESWPLALATLGIVLVGKPLAAYAVVRLLGKPLHLALSVSVALAQIGEFTFILAGMGIYYNVLPPGTMNALIAAAVFSIAVNSLLYGCIPQWRRWLGKPGSGEPEPGEEAEDEEDDQRVVVVGFGPAGRMMSDILRRNHIGVSVVEMNIDTVKRLGGEGVHVVYGDARQADVLRAAGVEKAVGLIISSASVSAAEVAEAARSINSGIRLVVHTTYAREASAFCRDDGAVAFSGEEEVAVSMAEYLLRQLGATDEQIQRERRCIRAELGC